MDIFAYILLVTIIPILTALISVPVSTYIGYSVFGINGHGLVFLTEAVDTALLYISGVMLFEAFSLPVTSGIVIAVFIYASLFCYRKNLIGRNDAMPSWLGACAGLFGAALVF